MKTSKYFIAILSCFMLVFIYSCQDKQAKDELAKFKDSESLEAKNISIAKKFYKYLDALQLDSVKSIITPDAKFFYESGDPISWNDIQPLVIMYYTSFPDYKHEIEDIFAAEDKVVVRFTGSATHTSKFMEIDPTGIKIKYKCIDILQFANNKLTNFWAVEDELGMMTQLGLELKPKGKK